MQVSMMQDLQILAGGDRRNLFLCAVNCCFTDSYNNIKCNVLYTFCPDMRWKEPGSSDSTSNGKHICQGFKVTSPFECCVTGLPHLLNRRLCLCLPI